MEAAAWFLVWGLAPSLGSAFSKLQARIQTKKDKEAPIKQISVFGETVEMDVKGFPDAPTLEQMECCMPGCQHGWFESCYEQTKLHYRYWLPTSSNNNAPPRAIVIFMHGIQTHSGKAYEIHDSNHYDRKLNMSLQSHVLLQNNIGLYAFDLYGHGYSGGRRFWISDYRHHVADLIQFTETVVGKRHPQLPIFFMGESYGCTLTLHAAKYFQDNNNNTTITNLDSLILTAPAIIGDLPPFPVYYALVFLAKLFPTWKPFFMPNPISPSRIWRDPHVLELRTNPSYRCIDGSGLPFRLGTALNLVRAMEDVRKAVIPELSLPFLILHGTQDHGVLFAGSEFLMEHAATQSTDKKFLPKHGAYHDLLSDFVAEECMQDIVEWIEHRLGNTK